MLEFYICMKNYQNACISFNLSFYQRVSIASYASAGIARAEMSVCPPVCLSVCHTPVLYQNEES